MNDKSKPDIKRGNARVNPGRTHIHRGIEYPENALLENLRDDQIARLEKEGVAKRSTDKGGVATV